VPGAADGDGDGDQDTSEAEVASCWHPHRRRAESGAVEAENGMRRSKTLVGVRLATNNSTLYYSTNRLVEEE
jgi:hypothetical protein